MRRPSTHRRAMTLTESVVSIVIVGVMLVAALNTLAGSVRGRQIRKTSGQARMLAFDLMSEILATYYEEPAVQVDQSLARAGLGVLQVIESTTKTTPVFGPELTEIAGRIDFDDVDDYHNYVDDPVSIKDGTALNGYDQWKRRVFVSYANPANAQPSGIITDTGLKLIFVEVEDPLGRKTTIQALRSRASAYNVDPTVQEDLISWVGIELKINGADNSVYSGSTSLNQSSY